MLELTFKRFGRKSLLGLHSVRWENLIFCIGYKNILVNLDDAPKVERTDRSGDLHHERAQRMTYSSETLENGSGYSR